MTGWTPAVPGWEAADNWKGRGMGTAWGPVSAMHPEHPMSCPCPSWDLSSARSHVLTGLGLSWGLGRLQ